jgi:hypothetical protein
MANRKSSTLSRIAASSDTCPVDRIHAEQCQLVIALNESKREKINGWSVDQMISDRMNANPKLVKMIQDWHRLDAQGAALGKAKQHKKSDAVTTKATDLLHAIGAVADRNPIRGCQGTKSMARKKSTTKGER